MNRTAIAASAAILLSVSLTGCFPTAQRADSPEREPDATPSSAGEALPEKCLTPAAGVIEKLQEDIAATVPGVEFHGHGVIKSESGEDFWYIALAMEDDGQPMTGTWGTFQDPTASGDIAYVAADDLAPLVSTYKQPVDFKGFTSTLIGADDCIPE